MDRFLCRSPVRIEPGIAGKLIPAGSPATPRPNNPSCAATIHSAPITRPPTPDFASVGPAGGAMTRLVEILAMLAQPLPHDVKKAIDLLRGDLARAWRIGDLARRCDVPRRTLEKHFRRFVG